MSGFKRSSSSGDNTSLSEITDTKRVKVEDSDKHFTGRPRTACDYCRRLKAKCDGGKPCSLCAKRGRSDACIGLEYLTVIGRNEIVKSTLHKRKRQFACTYCKKQRIKCNGKRPCDRCIRRDKEDLCSEEAIGQSSILSKDSYGCFKVFPKVLAEIQLSNQQALELLTQWQLKW
jgi:hypothetical protein